MHRGTAAVPAGFNQRLVRRGRLLELLEAESTLPGQHRRVCNRNEVNVLELERTHISEYGVSSSRRSCVLRFGTGSRSRTAFRSWVVCSDVVSQPLGVRVFRLLLQKLVVLDSRKVFASGEIVDSG